MTEKFEAFLAALEALCIEHGVRITGSRDYDDYNAYLEVATEEAPAGCEIDFVECRPPTPEEIAAQEAENARNAAYKEAQRAEWQKQQAVLADARNYLAQQEQSEDELRALITKHGEGFGDYVVALAERTVLERSLCREMQTNATRTRSDYMRVTRIPGDANDIGDKTCRVWCNEVEVIDWTVADDFRRIVEAPGRVLHGAVRIEMGNAFSIPAEAIHLTIAEPAQPVGFHGLIVYTPDEPPVVEASAEPAPTFAAPAIKVAPKRIPARKRKGSK
jgi:hypothetical protein